MTYFFTIYVHEARDSASWISDVKFFPDGTALAVASTDNNIYTYSTTDWSFLCKCDTHDHPITHFDFSKDSKTIQATDSGFIKYWHDADSGDQIRDIREVSDTAWDQYTCPLGWTVQGIWPQLRSNDAYRVNALHREPTEEKLVVSGDNFGFVNLFRYPTTEAGAVPCTVHGHSASVSNVRFSGDGKIVLSCGGKDKSVIQWKVIKDIDGADSADEMDDDGDPASDMEDEVNDFEDFEPDEIMQKVHDGEMEFVLSRIINTDQDNEDEPIDEEAEEADKPWLTNCLEPSVVPEDDPSSPIISLELDWVHGYSSQTMRNNVFYSKDGHVVYPAGQHGIVFNTDSWKQQFMAQHTNDITCLAMHPEGRIVATAHKSSTPSIIVWPCTFIAGKTHLRPLVVLKGQHLRAVVCLRFSPDGQYLISIGVDPEHRMVVYDWKDASVKARVKTGKKKVMDCIFCAPEDKYYAVTAGMSTLKFWKRAGRNLTFERAILGRKGLWQSFLCLSLLGNDIVVGTQDGHIYRFRGKKLMIAIKAHAGPIYTFFRVPKKGLVSGGRDGIVKIWNLSLEMQRGFDISKLKTKPIKEDIRSVCWDPSQRRILVGTKGSEIFELDAKSGKNVNDGALICGHMRWELHGLSTHPTRQEYCTVGDDMTVRVWDADAHKLKKMELFDCHLRACQYDGDGGQIAVGMGGDIGEGKNKKDGAWMVLHSGMLSVQIEAQDSLQPISDIKFSEDKFTLGVASLDRQVYLYDIQQDYGLRAQFNRNIASVTHFDFTEDSEFLMTNSADGELLFANCEDGKLISNASSLRDMKWHTFTSPYSWPSQGVHHQNANAPEINAVHRSHKGDYCATVDEWGDLKLWRYPCVKVGKPHKRYYGHSSRATNVRWTAEDKFVITTGGNDRCVLQWKVNHDAVPVEMIGMDAVENIPAQDDYFRDIQPYNRIRTAIPGLMTDASGKQIGPSIYDMSPKKQKVLKPWLATMSGPKEDVANYKTGIPDISLELEHVYGYKSENCHSNIFYNDIGEIVYPAAGVGIIYNKETNSQKFYFGHDDDLTSLAISPCAKYVATGQLGCKPRIRIWDSESGQEIAVCKRVHEKAITFLNFSSCSTRIVSVGADAKHTIVRFQN